MKKTLSEFIKYNCSHRREVIRIEKQCLGYNTFLTRFHDLDKLIMKFLFIPDKWISKLHRYFSGRHVGNKIGWFRLNEAMFDWESARFTKSDKPLNARETCLKLYPKLKGQVIPLCDKWKIGIGQENSKRIKIKAGGNIPALFFIVNCYIIIKRGICKMTKSQKIAMLKNMTPEQRTEFKKICAAIIKKFNRK